MVSSCECARTDTAHLLIASALFTLFYFGSRIHFSLFWHAGFKQTHSVIELIFCLYHVHVLTWQSDIPAACQL